jgi:hypothetical protein
MSVPPLCSWKRTSINTKSNVRLLEIVEVELLVSSDRLLLGIYYDPLGAFGAAERATLSPCTAFYMLL